jgi:hypothetical protein
MLDQRPDTVAVDWNLIQISEKAMGNEGFIDVNLQRLTTVKGVLF